MLILLDIIPCVLQSAIKYFIWCMLRKFCPSDYLVLFPQENPFFVKVSSLMVQW